MSTAPSPTTATSSTTSTRCLQVLARALCPWWPVAGRALAAERRR